MRHNANYHGAQLTSRHRKTILKRFKLSRKSNDQDDDFTATTQTSRALFSRCCLETNDRINFVYIWYYNIKKAF